MQSQIGEEMKSFDCAAIAPGYFQGWSQSYETTLSSPSAVHFGHYMQEYKIWILLN